MPSKAKITDRKGVATTKRPGPSSPFSPDQIAHIDMYRLEWDSVIDTNPADHDAHKEWCANIVDVVFRHPLFKDKLDYDLMEPKEWKEVSKHVNDAKKTLIAIAGTGKGVPVSQALPPCT